MIQMAQVQLLVETDQEGKMLEKLQRKLNSRGLSLAETLITIIILSIILSAVTGGSVVALRVYRQVRRKADAQTLLSTTINAMAENLYYSHDVSVDNNGNVISFYSETLGFTTSYSNGIMAGKDNKTLDTIVYTVNADDGTRTTYPIVSNKTQTLNQNVKLVGNMQYNSGYYTFTVSVSDSNGEIEEETAQIHTALVSSTIETKDDNP